MIIELLTSLFSYINVTTALVFLTVSLVTWSWYNTRGLPPGPWGLPIVGYLPFMARGEPEKIFNQLSKRYGNIMSLSFGPYQSVVLNNFEAIKEAYVKKGDIFSGRPDGLVLKIKEKDKGVFISEGDIWKDHRRFSLSTLRDYGIGKNSIEPRILEEIHYLLEELAKQKGQSYDFNHLLGMSTANIISTLEFGKRFEYHDKKFQALRKLQSDSLELFSVLPIRAFYPSIAKLPILESITHEKELIRVMDKFEEFINEMVKEHERDYIEGSRHDYIDAYFTERNSIIKKTGNEGYFTYAELEGTLQGLFGAGTETTTTTLRWAILALLVYPEMQSKIHKEIDDIIGMERTPTMSDKNKMPYTDAFLLEVQRFGSIVPLGVMHSNMEETDLFGYRIPKKSLIFINQWAVHFDPNLWDKPELFLPERFMTDKGQVEKPEYLIPFGIGKRLCMGEPLARMELFLYFASLLQRFSFSQPKDSNPSLENYENSFIRRPKPFEVHAVERKGYHVM